MPHLLADNATYFITARTLCKIHYFDTFNKKQIVLDQIKRAQKKFQIKIYAFAILNNHYHLLIEILQGADLPKVMQLISGGSSFLLNKNCQIKKNIWRGYWDKLIKNEDMFIKVYAYILGNPLKHKVVKNFFELKKYKFCSFRQALKYKNEKLLKEWILNIMALKLDEELYKQNPFVYYGDTSD